jgi:hypothetical protein
VQQREQQTHQKLRLQVPVQRERVQRRAPEQARVQALLLSFHKRPERRRQ